MAPTTMRAPDYWDTDGRLARMLTPLGWLYGGAGRLRRACTAPRRAGRPVICVGNLVSGGAGKTPVSLALQAWWATRGRNVHFLSRGYGGRLVGPVRVDPAIHDVADVGDEPLLLARRAPTWVSRDRVAGAATAVAAGADLVVMDDGHQNPGLYKDLSLVVVDAEYGFGNGRVVPAGPMREPLAAGLARADAVILVEGGDGTRPVELPPGHEVLHARLVPGAEASALAGRRVLAFAGIGRPAKFFATLERIGCTLIGREAFPDHHRYRQGEVDRLIEAACAAGAVPVTTEKDAMRISAAQLAQIMVLPVAIEWRDPAALDRLMQRVKTDG